MGKVKRVAVLILTWNSEQRIAHTLEKLFSVEDSTIFDCYIVDNGSRDNTIQVINSLTHNIEILELPINTGFAGGNNLGWERIKGMNYEFIYFMSSMI